MFLRPAEPHNYEFISAHGINAHGKSIKVIRLPKYMHQDNTDNFSVAIVLVHDMSRPPSSFGASIYANSLQTFDSDEVKDEYWNSFTILCEKEFGRDEITHVEEPFIQILEKLWDAIKKGDTCFDFNEHTDTE